MRAVARKLRRTRPRAPPAGTRVRPSRRAVPRTWCAGRHAPRRWTASRPGRQGRSTPAKNAAPARAGCRAPGPGSRRSPGRCRRRRAGRGRWGPCRVRRSREDLSGPESRPTGSDTRPSVFPTIHRREECRSPAPGGWGFHGTTY